jgi:hypothetical protein
MAGTVVPFTFVPGKTNLSDFRTLTRPLRAMSVREEWVYNQVAVDWAQLDGQTQKLVYAKACITDLAPTIWQEYWDAVAKILEGVDRIHEQYGTRSGVTAPKRDHLAGSSDMPLIMERFATRLIESTGTCVLALMEAGGLEMGRIASRSLDPPSEAELIPRRGRSFWQRLLEGGG